MKTAEILYYIFILTAVLAAGAILFVKNLFKGALWLLVCLLSVAALFILSFAEFVGVAQILIYAGGVLVVILFGIMFTAKNSSTPHLVTNTNVFSGALTGLVLFALLAKLIVQSTSHLTPRMPVIESPIAAIGTELINRYALPFEVIGILLLVTLIGASVVSAFTKVKRS